MAGCEVVAKVESNVKSNKYFNKVLFDSLKNKGEAKDTQDMNEEKDYKRKENWKPS